jgi:hypothetical protein
MKNVRNWKKHHQKKQRTKKQANKEWFDEECAKENEEKYATRERVIQNNTRGAKNAYKIARTKKRRLFRK